MRAALLAALLAACSPPPDAPKGAARVPAGPGARGFALTADCKTAAWVEGAWPGRTELALSALREGTTVRRRFKGYTLVSAGFRDDGKILVEARALGFSENPNSLPARKVSLVYDLPTDSVLSTGAPAGLPEATAGADGTLWRAIDSPQEGWSVEGFEAGGGRHFARLEVPGKVESLLAERDALYAVLRASEALSGSTRGPRTLLKLDLRSESPAWTAPWAPRPTRLLRRCPEGRLAAAVEDDGGSSLWLFPDDAKTAEAVGAASGEPAPGASRLLRVAGLFLARLLPALLLAVLFYSLRR